MGNSKDLVKSEGGKLEKALKAPVVVPLVDIFENDDEILLYAEMPGVVKDEVTVNLDNGNLDLVGYRKMNKEAGATEWEEFGNLEYRRRFSVPQTIDVAKVEAELKDGVLQLHLPKSEAAKPKRIEIKAS